MGVWTSTRQVLREKRTIVGIVVVALVAAYTGWRRVATPPTRSADLPSAATRGADYTLDGFTLTLLDEQGRPAVSLTGEALEHDPRLERSRIRAPEAEVATPGEAVWRGAAREGWVADDGGELQLAGDVRLTRLPGPGVTRLELSTQALTLYPERDQARTAKAVTIVQPGAELRGVGMLVDLAQGSYQLNANVRGRYDTPDSN